MKKIFFIYLMSLMVLGIVFQGNAQENKSPIKLKNKMDTISYIIGNNIGSNFKQNGLEVNTDILYKAIEESKNGVKSVIPDSIVKKVMSSFQKEMMAKQEAQKKEEAEKNKKEGAKYLEENKKKQGVIALPSGLQYKIIKAGTGDKPMATDKVKVNYEGTLIDGTIFDSSYERKQPAEFPVNQVIKGWTEALQLMPVGSTWELYIPSDLAYGDRATGKITPGSTLIFKVELLSIEKEKKEEKK